MSQMTAVGSDFTIPDARGYRDGLGVAASVLCAIHCAAMPFVVGFLPLLGLGFLAEPSFHKWMVGVCLALALLAFVPGWRQHRRLTPALIGLGGLGLISFAAFAGPEECCPTPCGESAMPAESTMTVAAAPAAAPCIASCCDETEPTTMEPAVGTSTEESGEPCVASCCAASTDDTQMPTVAAAEPASIVPVDPEPACVETCCASERDASFDTTMTVAAVPASDESTPCTAECCPEQGEAIALAGPGEFMSMVWLLMTPLGGVILVVAHLTNHRLSRCQKPCCATDLDARVTT